MGLFNSIIKLNTGEAARKANSIAKTQLSYC